MGALPFTVKGSGVYPDLCNGVYPIDGVYMEEREVTPAQRDVYLVIDEWWKRFGFGPTIDEVMMQLNVKGRGNVARKMKTLVDLGICRGIPGRARSIRPSYLRVRDII